MCECGETKYWQHGIWNNQIGNQIDFLIFRFSYHNHAIPNIRHWKNRNKPTSINFRGGIQACSQKKIVRGFCVFALPARQIVYISARWANCYLENLKPFCGRGSGSVWDIRCVFVNDTLKKEGGGARLVTPGKEFSSLNLECVWHGNIRIRHHFLVSVLPIPGVRPQGYTRLYYHQPDFQFFYDKRCLPIRYTLLNTLQS